MRAVTQKPRAYSFDPQRQKTLPLLKTYHQPETATQEFKDCEFQEVISLLGINTGHDPGLLENVRTAYYLGARRDVERCSSIPS